MKKLIISLFTIVLCFMLFGCSKEYSYKFINEDGSILLEGMAKEGTIVEAPKAPSKESTERKVYEFTGWDKEIAPLTEDTVYTAVFKEVTRLYKVKFVNDDGSVIKELDLEYEQMPVVDFTPIKKNTNQHEYAFEKWDKEITKVTEDTTYKAIYKESSRLYTVKYVNDDGSLLKEDKVSYNTKAGYNAIPQKESTAEFEYIFEKWDKEFTEVVSDCVYTAIYKEVKRKYTYTFVDYNGLVLKEETVEYGTMPVAPDNPSRKPNAEFTFKFSGWDQTIKKVTSDITYTAVYDEKIRSYTYKFVNHDGTVLKEETVDYGTMPIAPDDPVREEDQYYTYTFSKWDKTIMKVTSNVVYKATYVKHLKKIQFNDITGKKLSILGDSISTFYSKDSDMNSYYGEEGRYYYPIYCGDVRRVELTWWGQLLNNTKMELGINNSWSGSTAVGSGESAGCSDIRIRTLIENGKPDIVILYLGTNDVCSGISASEFISAYETILTKLYNICTPQVYVCTLGYSPYKGMKYTEKARLQYNAAIREFASKHDIGVIPIDEYVVEDNYSYYLNDNLHYKYNGTTLLSKIVEKAICDYNKIEYKGKIDVFHPQPEVTGHVEIGAYNTGVWDDSVYPNKVLLYSYDKLDKNSSYIFYYAVKITKEGSNYKVTGKKDLNIAEDFKTCDYYILINDTYSSHKFFDEVSIGDILELTGDIESGKCEFTKK